GASVAVQVWSGALGEKGSTRLAVARADRALAAPISREVATACDGPDRDYARHGFQLALPVGTSGRVFVYAMDEATADGPASPPSLIRNGVVQLPGPPPRPSPLAVVTTGWIEAPSDGQYV